MANVVFQKTYYITKNVSDEEMLQNDDCPGVQYLYVMNNTEMDINVLMFRKRYGTTEPVVMGVSAGKTAGLGVQTLYFEIWSENLQGSSTVISPPGVKGGYGGAGRAPAGSVGSISVVGIDEPMPPQGQGNGASVGAQVTIEADNVGLAKDGTDITAAVMPAGGRGIRGWLSALVNLFTNGSAKVSISASSEPLPTNPATAIQVSDSYTAAGADNHIDTNGFVYLSIVNDDPSDAITFGIDEDSTAAAKPITVKPGEQFSDCIKGTVVHYSAASGTPEFRLLAR